MRETIGNVPSPAATTDRSPARKMESRQIATEARAYRSFLARAAAQSLLPAREEYEEACLDRERAFAKLLLHPRPGRSRLTDERHTTALRTNG